MVTIAPQPRSL